MTVSGSQDDRFGGWVNNSPTLQKTLPATPILRKLDGYLVNCRGMRDEEVIKYLESLLTSRDLPDWAGRDQHSQEVTIVTCMDGRLNQFLRPFRFVIRTAGAVLEPVEGSVGLASESTGATFLATHGDCLAYKAAIEYLATSFAGKRAEDSLVRNLNRNDTKPLLTYINTQKPLNALPDPNDQNALAELAIKYVTQWTASNLSDKPRVGLFMDITSLLARQPQVWIVSYNRFSGPGLANFLHTHGMSEQVISTRVLNALHVPTRFAPEPPMASGYPDRRRGPQRRVEHR